MSTLHKRIKIGSEKLKITSGLVVPLGLKADPHRFFRNPKAAIGDLFRVRHIDKLLGPEDKERTRFKAVRNITELGISDNRVR